MSLHSRWIVGFLIIGSLSVLVPDRAEAAHRLGRNKSASLLVIFPQERLHCGTTAWTFPVLLRGSEPLSACILRYPAPENLFGGSFGF